MPLSTTQDLLFLMLAISIPAIAIFLCWALYEIARVFRQTNMVMTETREKIGRVERALTSIKERLESSAGYLAVLAEGGKSLLSYFQNRTSNEDQDEMPVNKKRLKR